VAHYRNLLPERLPSTKRALLTCPSLPVELRDSEPWAHLGRGPFLVEQARPGVFAVGDVRSGSTRMVAPAVGEGGMAVRFVAEHLAWSSRLRRIHSLANPHL
jgi:hypothetical protein